MLEKLLDEYQKRKFAVVAFKDKSCEVVPTIWLDIDDDELVSFYPPPKWSDSRIRNAVKDCEDPTGLQLHKEVRVLHTYNSLLVARANCQIAEDTSNLESECEELGGRRKRRRVMQLHDSDDDDENTGRSKHPPPPSVLKSVENSVRGKLNKLADSRAKNKGDKGILIGNSPKPSSSRSSSSTRDTSSPAWTSSISESSFDLDTPSFDPTDMVEINMTEGEAFGWKTPGKSIDPKAKPNVTPKPLTPAEQMTMVSVQVDIKKRLDGMERMLCSVLRALKPSQKIIVPKELPSLPLKTMNEFEENEVFLSNSDDRSDTTEFLSKCIPNVSVKDQVYFIMRKTMSDSLAANFNWKGRNKKSFCTSRLCAAVTGAILDFNKQQSTNLSIIGEIENAIKEWLKYAPKRGSKAKELSSPSSVEGDH